MKLAVLADTATQAQALRRLVEPTHQLVWQALDADEARQQLGAEPPQLLLLLLDNEAGVERMRRLQGSLPCPVLLVTTLETPRADLVFAALGHGARDVIDLPGLTARPELDACLLLRRIRNIALLSDTAAPRAADAAPLPSPAPPAAQPLPPEPWPALIAVGASAGGPATLKTLLGGLPAGFRGAVVLVQHLDGKFSAGMADWLARECALPVRLAHAGQMPQPGVVLLAGGDHHLCVKADGGLAHTDEPAGLPYRPSVDVLFQSLARHWRGTAVGVLLTGMGNDGAQGLKAMRERGFTTIAQDRASSAVWGMPKAAVALDAATEVLPLSRIAGRLQELCP